MKDTFLLSLFSRVKRKKEKKERKDRQADIPLRMYILGRAVTFLRGPVPLLYPVLPICVPGHCCDKHDADFEEKQPPCPQIPDKLIAKLREIC